MAKGMNYQSVNHAYFTGTTCTTADSAAASKKVVPVDFVNAVRRKIANLHGEGVYLESADPERDGINFPTAVVEVDGDNPVEIKIVRLTDSKYVVFSNVDGEKLEGTVVDVTGTTPVAGTIATINNADTDSWNAVPIGTAGTHFALIYRDEGGDDYVYGRIGSVSGTTITMGAEKALDGTDAGTEVSGVPYDVCEPRAGVLFFTWHDSDGDLASVAAPYTGVTVGTLGTQSEIDTAAPREIACCKIEEGYVFVAYGDGGDSNNLHGRVASVSAAGAIGTYGTERDLISTGDAAATFVSARYVEQNKVIVFCEDASNDPAAFVATTAAGATTITVGTFNTFLAGSVTDVGGDMIDNTQGVIKWDNGTNGDCVRFTIATTTITADAVIDQFVETASVGGQVGGIACTSTGKVVIAYEDADNDVGIKVGQYYEDRIIDIRSSSASATYTFDLEGNFKYEASN